MPRKIIIDTDPGIDDAMAILMALRSPALQVLGLTTVYGNHRLDVTTRNALSLLAWMDRGDVPVARGAGRPLLRPMREVPVHVHGEDGFGDASLPQPEGAPLDVDAADFIVQQVLAQPGQITLVAIGPLTNLALALQRDERVAQAVQDVVIMGGALAVPGNVTPVAEANVHADPQAAARVFDAPWPVTMLGLDVTESCVTDSAYLRALCEVDNRAGRLLGRIFPVYQRYHEDAYGLDGGTYTHDPLAVAYVLDPTLFGTASGHLAVELDGESVGQTVLDRAGTPPSCRVCVDVDEDGLLQLMWSCLGQD